MKGICRWILPETDDAEDGIQIAVPEDTVVEAVEITEQGPIRRLLERDEESGLMIFPEVHVWDDPSRSPPLQREGKDWRTENTSDLLRLWEKTRLEQFKQYFFRHCPEMQVVYRQPPCTEETHFHYEEVLYQGWRVEMVAAIFGGFKPEGLDPFEHKVKIIEPVRPSIHLV